MKLKLPSHALHESHGGIADILLLANAESRSCKQRLFCPLRFQLTKNLVIPLVQANDLRANAFLQF